MPKAPSKPEPVSLRDRVRASEARKLENGGRRMPVGIMPADVAQALDRLIAADYGATMTACIHRALLEADKRQQRKAPR